MLARRHSFTLLWLILTLCVSSRPARAVLDVENRGPQLTAGAFTMRITNIGALGNPFFRQGRSFDSSLEFPRGSGQQMLEHAELWVGAINARGVPRVSGGPLLEWRPTLAPEDHVRTAYAGNPGTLRFRDDDGDGAVDEEFLDGIDEDGDGEVDEDLGLFATQTLFARYRDDQPEAIAYDYLNGEDHEPLHLEVKQEAFTWAINGFDHVAGVKFVITNRGDSRLTQLWLGLSADMDATERGEIGGHLNDVASTVDYEQLFNDGISSVPSVLLFPPISTPYPYFKECLVPVQGRVPVIADQRKSSGVGSVALVPLWHTTDPLGLLVEQNRVSNSIVAPYRFAPTHVAFRSQYFANDMPPGQGGMPTFDVDRYRALAGEYPALENSPATHDYVVLVSCGPFAKLDPGQSLEMHLAFVVAAPESLRAMVEHAVQVHHGGWANAVPDAPANTWGDWSVGRSGVTGHETCYEPPEGLVLTFDPHCVVKYIPDPAGFEDTSLDFRHGRCIWSDLDCDACTGFDGRETQVRWRDPAGVPFPPQWRVVPGDRVMNIEWDDRSEVLEDAQLLHGAEVRFIGYNIYRLDDWSDRRADLPSFARFQQVASFGRVTLLGARPLSEVTDTTVAPERILYERRVHPIGRYRWQDRRVRDGFDYVYAVTAVTERTLRFVSGDPITELLESPILASIDSLASPRVTARAAPGGVWVVPNPYRGDAPWERPPVPGDTFGRHLDFMGLPKEQSVIRIYTLAGDLVQTLHHDGSRGDGQARWNLISRNGQDIASGVYLFTVESPGGHQTGRFVVLR